MIIKSLESDVRKNTIRTVQMTQDPFRKVPIGTKRLFDHYYHLNASISVFDTILSCEVTSYLIIFTP